ncbi:MAG: hypothetical protein Q8K70_06775 [Bacteroidota bacterium]|nr:hypothetical protein [Bacteroidota bacterium]
MNHIRLKQIYENVSLIDSEAISQLKNLIDEYPYYYLPYVILAKYYYKRDNDIHVFFLKQASIRVQDRKCLYEYIHEKLDIKSSVDEIISEKEEVNFDLSSQKENQTTSEIQLEGFDSKNDAGETIEAFEISESETISIEIQPTTDVNEFLQDFEKEDEVSIAENDEPTDLEIEEIQPETEAVDEIEDLQEIKELATEIENEIVETESTYDNSLIESEPEVLPEIETIETVTIAATESEEEEIEFTIHSNDFNQIESEDAEAIEPENETIIEDYQEDFVLSNPIETKEETEISELLELRKNPIYSIEQALASKSKVETTKVQAVSSEMDFFEWLKHPENNSNLNQKHEEENAFEIEEEPIERHQSMDLIEKFITVSPQISRPKKEFFSAENMAKKSEVLELDFVSETLANLYLENGSFDLAIKVYEKLSLQNPSKKPYFASLIKKIKKENK